jgi:hypothetical protein
MTPKAGWATVCCQVAPELDEVMTSDWPRERMPTAKQVVVAYTHEMPPKSSNPCGSAEEDQVAPESVV